MNTFTLEILTPEKPFFTGECVSMTMPASDGMIGIMANHTPLTAAVTDGMITFTSADGEVRMCAVSRGMVNVGARRELCADDGGGFCPFIGRNRSASRAHLLSQLLLEHGGT